MFILGLWHPTSGALGKGVGNAAWPWESALMAWPNGKAEPAPLGSRGAHVPESCWWGVHSTTPPTTAAPAFPSPALPRLFWGWCWPLEELSDASWESWGFRSLPMALESEHWLLLNCLGPRRRGAGKIRGLQHPWQVPWETMQKAHLGYWWHGVQGRIRTGRAM